MGTENKVEAALNGSPTEGGGQSEIDELRKQLQTERVEAGRLKKAMEENARLKAENEKLKAGGAIDAAISEVPENLREETTDGILRASVTGAQKLVDKATGELREENRKLREEMDRRDYNSFVQNLSVQHAKFFESVAPGGDKAQMWEAFKASNKETFGAIMASHDVARFGELVDAFYRKIGIPNPSGVKAATAAPDPAHSDGGTHEAVTTGDDQSKKYTGEEYLRLLEQAETDFRNHTIDLTKYRAVTAGLNKALREGRVS